MKKINRKPNKKKPDIHLKLIFFKHLQYLADIFSELSYDPKWPSQIFTFKIVA